MHTINLEIPSHRSIPHASNLGREIHVHEDKVHFRRNFILPNGYQHGPTDRDHIHFDENIIAMHKRF